MFPYCLQKKPLLQLLLEPAELYQKMHFDPPPFDMSIISPTKIAHPLEMVSPLLHEAWGHCHPQLVFLLTHKCPVSTQDRVNFCSSCEEGSLEWCGHGLEVILYHLMSVAGASSKGLSGFQGEGLSFPVRKRCAVVGKSCSVFFRAFWVNSFFVL